MRVQAMLLLLGAVAFSDVSCAIRAVKCCEPGKRLHPERNDCVPMNPTSDSDVPLGFVPLNKLITGNETEGAEVSVNSVSDNKPRVSATEDRDINWLPEVLKDKIIRDSEIVFGRRENCSDAFTVRLETPRDNHRMQWMANGSFVLRSYSVHGNFKDLLLQPHDFCTDTFIDDDNRTHRAYLSCLCGRVNCLRKCCPLGQTFTRTFNVAKGTTKFLCDAYKGSWTPFDRRVRDTDVPYETVVGKVKCPEGSQANIQLMYRGIPEHIIQTTWIEAARDGAVCEDTVVVREQRADALVVEAEVKGIVRCFPNNPYNPLIVYIRWLHVPQVVFWALVMLATELVPRKDASAHARVHDCALACHALSLLLRSLVLLTKNLWDRYCEYTSVMIYFLSISAIMWLTVLSINMACAFWRPLGAAGGRRRRCSPPRLWASLFGWGLSAALTAFTGFMWYAEDVPRGLLRPTMHDTGTCFMETDPSQKVATFAYFYGPVAFLLLVDAALILFAFVRARQTRRDASAVSRQHEEPQGKQDSFRDDKRALTYITVLLALGVVQMAVEFTAWLLHDHGHFWFTVLWVDILRAFAMFVTCCCNKRAARAVRDRVCARSCGRKEKQGGAQGAVGQYSESRQ